MASTVIDLIRELANGDLTPDNGVTILISMEDHLRLAHATSPTEMAMVKFQFHLGPIKVFVGPRFLKDPMAVIITFHDMSIQFYLFF